MRESRFKLILGAVLLAALLTVGLGFTYLARVDQAALAPMIVHETWIPLLPFALGAVGCLCLMDAVREMRRENPLNLLPALVLGMILCGATDTPILWVRYKPSYWQIPYAALFVLALMLVWFVRLLRSGEARAMRWDGKQALKWMGILALCMIPALAGAVFSWARRTLDIASGFVLMPIYALSGATGLWVVRRGRRGAGALLLSVGGLGIVLYALIRRFLPNGPWEGASFLSARIVNGFYAVECLSAYSFCVFGGVKALLRPKAP